MKAKGGIFKSVRSILHRPDPGPGPIPKPDPPQPPPHPFPVPPIPPEPPISAAEFGLGRGEL
jgi:hypothetical protein